MEVHDPEKGIHDDDTTHSSVRNISNSNNNIYAPSHASSSDHDTDREIERIQTHISHTSRTGKSKTKLSNLAKTITARSNASVIDPGPPPDGGLKAWTQSLMGHFVVFNTWGMIATFGVFQAYYTNELGLEASAVSWIGSMQMLGHFGLGMFSGRMFDAGWFRWVVVPGMLLVSLGTMMTSLCHSYWQFFLAQGLLTGLGCGLQFAPTISLVTTYFSRNRSVAVAIMASGSASGGLVYPTIARQLMPRIGFPWTVRVMGFMMLVVGSMYCSLLKPRLPPRKSGPLFEFSAFREPPYSLFLLGIFLIGLGQYFAFYYISSFAVDVLGVSYATSVNVLLVLNGVGILGRLIPSYFADRWTGPYNVLIPFCFVSSIILFFWPLVHSESGLYGWAVCYGFFVAGFQGTFPAVLTTLTKDMSRVGTRNGMGFAIMGVGTLIGPPIAGALIQSHGGSYLAAQMFGGATVLIGSCVLVIGRAAITGWTIRVRA